MVQVEKPQTACIIFWDFWLVTCADGVLGLHAAAARTCPSAAVPQTAVCGEGSCLKALEDCTVQVEKPPAVRIICWCCSAGAALQERLGQHGSWHVCRCSMLSAQAARMCEPAVVL